MTIGRLKAIIAAAESAGEVSDQTEVRVHTGWEGPELLEADAGVEDGDDGRCLLIRQA